MPLPSVDDRSHDPLRRACLGALAAAWAGMLVGCRSGDGPQGGAGADEARIVEERVPSAALGREMGALVYLPSGYQAGRRYPVLYLYHGMRESKGFWGELGLFERATELVRAGRIQPLIIVTPQLDNSFGVNNAASYHDAAFPAGPVTFDGGRYEDYLVNDLVDFIDARYPTRAERDARWVGGISMGGFAALHAAMRHPDRFSRAGGHSPALIEGEFAWLYPPEVPRASRDVLRLAQLRDLAGLEVFLDCGQQDDFGFAPPTKRLAQTLAQREVAVQTLWPAGRHERLYWMEHLAAYLAFYAGR